MKLLYIRRVELNHQISTATPAELQRGHLNADAAKVETDITKNIAAVSENESCVTAGINQQSGAREEIIKTKEVANEAQLIAIQTQQLEELVVAQVNQSQAIETEIEGELAQEFNQTSETVKHLVKEQTSMTNQKTVAKKTAKEASKIVESQNKDIKDITNTIADKTADKDKLTIKISDPVNASNQPQIQNEIDAIENEIKTEEAIKNQKEQDVNKAQKEEADAKEQIKEIEKTNSTLNE